MRHVFFSYATEDRPRVMQFVPAFQAVGVAVYIDHEQIRLGGAIAGRINEMIAQSDGAIIFYSAVYARKLWTREEQDALIFRAVERDDYQIVVVRLDDDAQLPPLLAHRLWAREPDAQALAAIFAANLRHAIDSQRQGGNEVRDWRQTFTDDELERMALSIHQQLKERRSVRVVPFRSRRAGDLVVQLWEPLPQKLADNLSATLRIQEKVNFVRNDLRERLAVDDLGTSRGAFMLAEREKLQQIELFREELHTTLDALVERVILA